MIDEAAVSFQRFFVSRSSEAYYFGIATALAVINIQSFYKLPRQLPFSNINSSSLLFSYPNPRLNQ